MAPHSSASCGLCPVRHIVSAQGQALFADDAGPPSDAGLHQSAFAVGLDLQDFCEIGAERLPHEPAGLIQHVLKIVAARGEVAEIGENLLPH